MYKNLLLLQNFKVYLFLIIVLFSCKKDINKENAIKNEYSMSYKIYNYSTNIEIFYPHIRKKVKIQKTDLPIKSCIVVNTSTLGFLQELNLINKISAVCSPKYIYNIDIQSNIKNNKILDFGNDQNWNIEKILTSDIKFIFTSYNPNFENSYTLLENSGKKIIFIEEYRENHPLGKTEYLKLFGILFGNESNSFYKFNSIKNNYNRLKILASKQKFRPSVFSKIMYGDIWYIPKAQSVTAQLFKDANLNYLWNDIEGTDSKALSFVQVYNKAKEADFWLDVSDIETKNQLLAQNYFYKDFNAFKNNKMYSLIGRKKNDANDFYESGTVRADWVLKDIISITYPDLFLNYNLIYYYKLK